MKDRYKYKLEDCIWFANGIYFLRHWSTVYAYLYDLDSFIFIAYKDNFNLKETNTLHFMEMSRK